MAAAYHIFKNGAVVAITKTAKTNPEIAHTTPNGNPAGDSSGVVGKTPGGSGKSVITGK